MEQSLNRNNIMRSILNCLLLMVFFNGYSQETETIQNAEAVKIDSLYREDQFYFGFTYNTLQEKPIGLSENKFSVGLSGGFLRDMPINDDRTIAIASGLGFSYNNYNQNLFISEPGHPPVYSIIASKPAYSKNKFKQ